jgi:renalase
MATRRLETPHGTASFDFGAQFFTVRDPGFASQVAIWADLGLASRWPDARDDAWIGVPTMNAVLRNLASQHEMRLGHHIHGLARASGKWRLHGNHPVAEHFDNVVLALPAEQTAPLLTLHDFELARAALFARSQPCWTGMFAFAGPLALEHHILRDTGVITWAARNSAKPGRDGPESWVVQATADWSTANLEHTPEVVGPMLLAALADANGQALPELFASSIHRWRFALSAGTGIGNLWNGSIGIGACGDWLLGPRVECAWVSGRTLAERMLAGAAETA